MEENKLSILEEPFETLSPMGKALKDYFVHPLINHIIPVKMLVGFLKRSKSPLIQESFVQPGSWKCMKFSYEKRKPVDFIDRVVYQFGTFPMGLRNRKRLVVRQMVKLIERYLGKGAREVNVVAVGAGTGINTIEALAHHPNKNVIAHLFDIEDEAFVEGEQLKRHHAVVERVHFIKADFREMKKYVKSTPHILELVGILEYFKDDAVLEFLEHAGHYLNHESSVLVNSIEDAHGIKKFLKRAFNFELLYRSPERMMELLTEAGYGDFEIEREPLQVYSAITAHKRA